MLSNGGEVVRVGVGYSRILTFEVQIINFALDWTLWDFYHLLIYDSVSETSSSKILQNDTVKILVVFSCHSSTKSYMGTEMRGSSEFERFWISKIRRSVVRASPVSKYFSKGGLNVSLYLPTLAHPKPVDWFDPLWPGGTWFFHFRFRPVIKHFFDFRFRCFQCPVWGFERTFPSET